jgi:hypothetical protein
VGVFSDNGGSTLWAFLCGDLAWLEIVMVKYGHPKIAQYALVIYHGTFYQWEFQDPKMKVLYHMFGHILWGYSLKFRPEK